MNTNFDYLSSRYLNTYLVSQQNLSENTRLSYHATFLLFEDYLEEQGSPSNHHGYGEGAKNPRYTALRAKRRNLTRIRRGEESCPRR